MSPILESAGFETRPHLSVEKLLEAQRTTLRGCFLLDVSYAGGACGFDLHEELIRRSNHLPVIFLTDHASIRQSVRATKAGALDFLTQDTSRETLIATVAAAFAKEQEIRNLKHGSQLLSDRLATLTARERQVFACVVSGMTNKQVGVRLGSTERTVRAHRSSVMSKMAVRSLAELVHQALELGIPVSGSDR